MSSKSGISEKLKGLWDRIKKLKTQLEQAEKELYDAEIDDVIEAKRDPKRIAEIIAEIERRRIADRKLEEETRLKNEADLKKYIEAYNAGKIPIEIQKILPQSRI